MEGDFPTITGPVFEKSQSFNHMPHRGAMEPMNNIYVSPKIESKGGL